MKKMPGDIIISHMCTINENVFLRYGVQRTEFFDILSHYLPFYPIKDLKNQNFQKIKETPADIIILHKFTKNHDHMLYTAPEM